MCVCVCVCVEMLKKNILVKTYFIFSIFIDLGNFLVSISYQARNKNITNTFGSTVKLRKEINPVT